MTSALVPEIFRLGIDAERRVLLDEVAAVDLHCADAAVVRALGRREAVGGKPAGPAVAGIDHGVFLLEAEPRLLIAVLLERFASLRPSVGRVRSLQVGEEGFAHDQDVVCHRGSGPGTA